jgi:hypothetical protein
MKGDLADLHEVRDRQGETLYRLFVAWRRKERRVVVIDGREKANKTKLSDAEYEAIRALARNSRKIHHLSRRSITSFGWT